ncbi:MAG: hypothetical protein AAF394_03195 [Planctomycetota bacterium]
MARQRRQAKLSSYLPLALIGLTSLGLVAFLGVGIAWMAGAFDEAEPEPIDRTGQLAYPALAVDVQAYEKLDREHFINPQTQQLELGWASESLAESGVVSRSMKDLIGRVMGRDVKAGQILSKYDLLDKGTRPGLVAGIPVGKFALSIPAAGVPGLEQLRRGDRFDLLVALPASESADAISNSEPAALFGGVKPPSLRVGQLSRQHGVKNLVTNGELIQLYDGESRSTTGTTGYIVKPNSRSKTTVTKVTFAEVAVDGEEVGALTEAISLGTKLTCVLRSGKPDEASDDSFSTEGLVPVITTAKMVPAYAALTEENLVDEATGKLHLYYFPPEKVAEGWITDATELYGRVIARSLRRGAILTESDLLPPGTRAGISAGLEPGMAAMSIAKANVQGFEKLAVGDSFSILTKVPGGVAAAAPKINWATLQGGRLSEEDDRIASMVRTGIREVVRDATYLSDSDEENVVIGVPDTDVAKLAQLLRDKAEVFAVARSSQARDSQQKNEVTHSKPDVSVMGDVRFVAQFANQDDRPGSIAIPILVRDVSAFETLSIDDFVDPATGRIQNLYFDENDVRKEWVRDIRQLLDRTPIRPLKSGRPVTQSDLAPAGTPPGIAVGLRAGERAITVNSAQLIGLEGLTTGSLVDIASASGVQVNQLGGTVRQVLSSSDAVREAGKLPSGRVSVSRVVAEEVRMLAHLGESTLTFTIPGVPSETQTQTRLLEDGTVSTETVRVTPPTTETRVVQRYVIAVREEQVGGLVGLLDATSPLIAAVRPLSGAPSESKLHQTRKPAIPPVRAVIREHISGTDVSTEVFLTDQPVLPPAQPGAQVPQDAGSK